MVKDSATSSSTVTKAISLIGDGLHVDAKRVNGEQSKKEPPTRLGLCRLSTIALWGNALT